MASLKSTVKVEGAENGTIIAKLKELPRRTDMQIEGEITWRGIHIDDFRAGGIRVAAMPDLSAGKGPTFGPNNETKPGALFTLQGPKP